MNCYLCKSEITSKIFGDMFCPVCKADAESQYRYFYATIETVGGQVVLLEHKTFLTAEIGSDYSRRWTFESEDEAAAAADALAEVNSGYVVRVGNMSHPHPIALLLDINRR
jgi:hypothetical protein